MTTITGVIRHPIGNTPWTRAAVRFEALASLGASAADSVSAITDSAGAFTVTLTALTTHRVTLPDGSSWTFTPGADTTLMALLGASRSAARASYGETVGRTSSGVWANTPITLRAAAPFITTTAIYPAEDVAVRTSAVGAYAVTLAAPAGGSASYTAILPDGSERALTVSGASSAAGFRSPLFIFGLGAA